MYLRNESLFHLPLSMIWVSDAPFIFISVANVTLIEWHPTSSSGIPSLSCPKILTACFRDFSISFDFNLIVWKGHFAWLNELKDFCLYGSHLDSSDLRLWRNFPSLGLIDFCWSCCFQFVWHFLWCIFEISRFPSSSYHDLTIWCSVYIHKGCECCSDRMSSNMFFWYA